MCHHHCSSHPPICSSSLLGLQICTAVPGFHKGPGDLNSGLHSCAASTLPMEPCPRPLQFLTLSTCDLLFWSEKSVTLLQNMKVKRERSMCLDELPPLRKKPRRLDTLSYPSASHKRWRVSEPAPSQSDLTPGNELFKIRPA